MIRLNRELQEQIVAGIRAGAFPQVAAAAFGVSRRSFRRWLRLGRSSEGDADFHAFAVAVHQAIAQTRLRAEMTMLNEQPKLWLMNGPGKETADAPGWTVAVKPSARARRVDPMQSPECLELVHILLDSLNDLPERRAQAAERVAEMRRRN